MKTCHLLVEKLSTRRSIKLNLKTVTFEKSLFLVSMDLSVRRNRLIIWSIQFKNNKNWKLFIETKFGHF